MARCNYAQNFVGLNKVLITLIHRGPTLNDILHRIVWVDYIILIIGMLMLS